MYISGKNQLYPRQLSDIAPPAPSIMLSQPKKTGGSTMVQVILWPKQGSKMKMIIFQDKHYSQDQREKVPIYIQQAS